MQVRQALKTLCYGSGLSLWAGVASANVVGGATENFHPTTDGIGFVTVQSAKTLPAFTFNLGLFLNHAINTLPIFDRVDGKQSHGEINDAVTTAHFHVGYGILPIWEIGISIPSIIAASAKDTDDVRGEILEKGITDYAVNTKVRFAGNNKWGIAGLASVNFSQLRDDPYTGESGGPTYTVELAGDVVATRRLLLGLNVGYRIRTPGDQMSEFPEVEPLEDTVIYSPAVSFALTQDDFLIGEVFGAAPAKSTDDASDRSKSSTEALVAYKHVFRPQKVSLVGGIGSELTHGRATPDWRFIAGVNWQIGVKQKREAPQRQRAAQSRGEPEIITVDAVLFAFNSDRLVLKGQNTGIVRLKDKLKQRGGFQRLVIVGHTDSVGAASYNRSLSYRRAVTLKNWLVSNYNINSRKIQAVGLGESQPIAPNSTPAGRRKNRRVEFKIYR